MKALYSYAIIVYGLSRQILRMKYCPEFIQRVWSGLVGLGEIQIFLRSRDITIYSALPETVILKIAAKFL